MSKLGMIYINDSSFNYTQVSIGIASILTYIQSHGHQAILYDTYYHSIEQIVKKCIASKPDIVGISTTQVQLVKALLLAQKIKSKFNCPIVFGGPYASLFPRILLQYSYIDYVCVGDGEITLNELLSGNKPKSIIGLWYKRNGRIIENGVSTKYNINSVSTLDYSMFNSSSIVSNRDINGRKIRFSFTWSSRGCPYGCAYCSNIILEKRLKYGIRYRNTICTIEEMSKLQRLYEPEAYFFTDENFLLNANHCEVFAAEYIQSRTRIPFGFLSRPEHICRLNANVIDLLIEAGWKWISIGVEIGDELLRNNIMKRTNTNKEIVDCIGRCKKYGIYTNIFLILGHYAEGIENLRETNNLIHACKPDSIECSILYPLRGTDIYRDYANKGLLKHEKPSIESNYFNRITIKHPFLGDRALLQLKKYWETLPHNGYSSKSPIIDHIILKQ